MLARAGLPSRLLRPIFAAPNFIRQSPISRVVLLNRRAPLSTAQWASKKGRFLTVAFPPEKYSQQEIIETTHTALANYDGSSSGVLGRCNTAVFLVSKGLAHWLDDPEFLSYLLAPWRGEGTEMDILAAVVDSVRVPQDPFDQPPTDGFAIMAREESEKFLPGLWEPSTPAAATPGQPDKASIEFHLPPLSEDERPLHVTLPLANTTFTNGKPHKMFAGRLTAEPEDSQYPTWTSMLEKTWQIVAPGKGPRYYSSISAPLVPITQARKVVTGLGNILRQVEIDGQPAPVPASKELEQYIPEFLEARSSPLHRLPPEPRPLIVWAVIYPENVASAIGYKLPAPVESWTGGSIKEQIASKAFMSMLPNLIGAGCHIRQVLSGGGGWGQKQGLLSLDPESRYTTTDHEDVESFIRSFKGEEAAGSGIVTPGSWVQFMVERATQDITWSPRPPPAYKESKKYDQAREVINLGVKDEVAQEPAQKTLRLSREYFGVSSVQGLYITSPEDASTPEPVPSIATKVAVPRAELVSFL